MKRGTEPPAGSFDGLAAFLDQMVKEGHVNQATGKAHKTASRKVVAAGEAAGLDPINYSEDIEPYAEAFERDQDGAYTPRSLANYVSRFKSAAAMYREYLDDPSWRPTQRPAAAKADPLPDGLIAYPFPLGGGSMAELRLPPTLTADQAERLTHFLRGLVVS